MWPTMTPAGQLPGRAVDDVGEAGRLLHQNVLSSLQNLPPTENNRLRLELSDVRFVDPETVTLRAQKEALLNGESLGRRVKGKWSLVDKASGQVLDAKDTTILKAPYLTPRATFINNGVSYSMLNQMRLRSGVYGRVKQTGEVESHVNALPGKGFSHRYTLDPDKGVFYLNVHQAKLPLLPALRALGATDDQIREAWGEELFYSNQKAQRGADLDRIYQRVVRKPDPAANEQARREAIAAALSAVELDPEVTGRTLGKPYKRLDAETVLTATKKLLAISRGEAAPDDRDHLAYQTVMGLEDLLPERLTKDAGGLRRELLWKLAKSNNLSKLPASVLQSQINAAILSSGLGQPGDETNPLEFLDKFTRITRMGTGGLPSYDAIPDESRSVSPSHLSFIDLIKTPESLSAGIDLNLSSGSRKGADGKLYTRVRNARTGAYEWKTAQDMADAVIGMPGTERSDMPRVEAMVRGKMDYAKPQEIDYYAAPFETNFSPASNLVLGKSGMKGQRSSMGSRMSVAGSTQIIVCRSTGEVFRGSIAEYRWADGDLSLSIDKQTYQLCWKPVRAKMEHRNTLPMYRVTLDSGRYVEATQDHSFVTLDDAGRLVPIKTQELQADTPIPVTWIIPDLPETVLEWSVPAGHKHNAYPEATFDLTYDCGWMHGLWLSEGYSRKDENGSSESAVFANNDDGVRGRIVAFMREKSVRGTSRSGRSDGLHDRVDVNWKQLVLKLKEDFGDGAYLKKIPSWILSTPKAFREGLVAGYIAGDGAVSVSLDRGLKVGGSSRSKSLRDGLCDVLLTLGIATTVHQHQVNTGPGGSLVWQYCFSIRREHLHKVPRLSHAPKDEKFLTQLWTGKRSADWVPMSVHMFAWLLMRKSGRGSNGYKRVGNDQHTRTSARQVMGAGNTVLHDWLSSDVCWEAVKHVTMVDSSAFETVYDLDLEDNVFFCNGGVFVHNSSQAVPLENPEAPLVRTGVPDEDDKSYEEKLGEFAGAVRSKVGGTVVNIEPGSISILPDGGGKPVEYEIYNNFPLARKTSLHNTPTVQLGQRVKPGDLLAKSNYTTDKGELALGANLKVAFMSYLGENYEDAFLISQSAADNKLVSRHMYRTEAPTGPQVKSGLSTFVSMYPALYSKDQLSKLGKDGVIREGETVEHGQPLVVAVKARESLQNKVHKKSQKTYQDASEVWEHEDPGVVKEVFYGKNGPVVMVETLSRMKEGDKLCYDATTQVLTDRGWVFLPDIKASDKVWSLVNGTPCFQSIEAIHYYPHGGDMIEVLSADVDLFVTANHNMFVRRLAEPVMHLAPARELVGCGAFYSTDIFADDEVWVESSQTRDYGYYHDPVFCVTVPGNTIYVRRNGKACWSGNSARQGNKGVVKILPDDMMPRGEDGEPFDVLINPHGTISRGNPTALLEAWLGKVAAKTGKPYKIKDFGELEDATEWVDSELKRNGMSSTEKVYDPDRRAYVKRPVATGNMFIMKLVHMAEGKLQARSGGGYTQESAPAKGGPTGAKRVGLLDTNALVAHNVPAVLRDASVVRGQRNDEWWDSFMKGNEPPAPRVPPAYDKFIDELRGAGVSTVRRGKQTSVSPMTRQQVAELVGDRLLKNTDTVKWDDLLQAIPGGLFDPGLTGGPEGRNFTAIALPERMPSPIMETPIRKLLGITENAFRDILAGKTEVNGKRGPAALESMLDDLDVQEELRKTREAIDGTKKTKRDEAIKRLPYLKQLESSGAKASDWMWDQAPVVPPAIRPVTVMGDDKIPLVSDPNYLYAELWHAADNLKQNKELLGDEVGEERLALYDALKAAVGLTDPGHPKLKEKGVQGLLAKVFSDSPKHSTLQRKLVSHTVDNVARGVVTPGPELDMDELSIPENAAWNLYERFTTRRLSRAGMSPLQAMKEVEERTERAKKAMLAEMEVRPVMMNRAPVLHRYGIMAFKPKMHSDADTIRVPVVLTKPYSMDFDGDEQLNSVLAVLPKDVILHGDQHGAGEYLENRKVSARFKATLPAVNANEDVVVVDLEDFPRGQKLFTKEGANGPIDWYAAIPGTKVLAYDENTRRLEWAMVSHWSKHYDREIEIVTLTSKRQIITDDDPRAVYGAGYDSLGLKRFRPQEALDAKVMVPVASYLSFEDEGASQVFRPKDYPCNNEQRALKLKSEIPLDADFGYLLGVMAGDGWVSVSTGHTAPSQFHVAGQKVTGVFDRFNETVTTLFDGPAPEPTAHARAGNGTDFGGHGDADRITYSSAKAARLLSDLLSRGAANKHLPPFFLTAPRDFRLGLFAGLIDTDGSISNVKAVSKQKPQLQCNFTSISIRMVNEVRLLAASLGIKGRITSFKYRDARQAWLVSFSSNDIKRWGGQYMACKPKLANLEKGVVTENSAVEARYDLVPFPKGIEEKTRGLVRAKDNLNLYNTLRDARGQNSLNRQAALRTITFLDGKLDNDVEFQQWVTVVRQSDIRWEKVISVEKTGQKETGYDLTVPGYETFMSTDGIILSNTVQVHVPATAPAVKEAYEKMLPSKMMLASSDLRSPTYSPQQEYVGGLYEITDPDRDRKHVHTFATLADAKAAEARGEIGLTDEVRILR